MLGPCIVECEILSFLEATWVRILLPWFCSYAFWASQPKLLFNFPNGESQSDNISYLAGLLRGFNKIIHGSTSIFRGSLCKFTYLPRCICNSNIGPSDTCTVTQGRVQNREVGHPTCVATAEVRHGCNVPSCFSSCCKPEPFSCST